MFMLPSDLANVLASSSEELLCDQMVSILKAPSKKYLHVGGIPPNTKADHLKLHLERMVDEAEVLTVTPNGQDTSMALVVLSDEAG